MKTISHTPAYNLKAVLKETGITADVLRAWERRYQLPEPHRTQGGHRLYSEYDIETIKWLRAKQAEGLSISRAVKLWKEIAASGHDPLSVSSPAEVTVVPDLQAARHAPIENLRRAWLEACLAFDERKAEEILTQAFALYPVETVCFEILQWGLHSIGRDWYLGKVSVHQEHFASALAVRRLQTLIIATPVPTRSQTILVGCPSGEWHTFPVLLLSLLLRRSGLGVVYLGADIALDRLEETASSIHPDLVVLAAQQLTTAATLRSAALLLHKKKIPASFGGLIFNRIPKLRQRIPAHFLGERMQDAAPQIERLLHSSPTFSSDYDDDGSYAELARLFREKRPIIEAGMYKIQQAGEMQTEYFMEANTFFGNGLSAALELGDPSLLELDLDWVKHLLTGRRISEIQLLPFLAVYCQSVQKEMGEVSAPITEWISAFMHKNGLTGAFRDHDQ